MRMESENETRKIVIAAAVSAPMSERDTSGMANDGSPLGTGPVMATPRAARSSAHDATMPRTTITSGPGMRLLILLVTIRNARERPPTMTVSGLASPRWLRMSSVSRIAPFLSRCRRACRAGRG